MTGKRIGSYLRTGFLMGAISLSACGKKIASAGTRKEKPASALSRQQAIVQTAKTYLGTPYQYGGMSRKGIDCSGLTCQVYREAAGLNLPRTADAQARVGKAIPLSQARAGDLVFFREPKAQKITHVGILISDGKEGRFIHASTSKGVREDSLQDQYWKSRLVTIRRVLPLSAAAVHTDPPEKSTSSVQGKARRTASAGR